MQMKQLYTKILITLLFSWVTFSSLASFFRVNAQVEYADKVDHYAFTMPNEWEEIPEDVLAQLTEESKSALEEERLNFVRGFQLRETESYFELPYILISEYAFDSNSYKYFEQQLLSDDFKREVETVADRISNFDVSSTVETPKVNRERGLITFNFKTGVDGSKELDGFSAIFVGKDKFTQFTMYVLSNESKEWMAVFDSIVETFEYDEGYGFQYPITEEQETTVRNIWPNIIKYTLVIITALLLFALIVRIVQKNKKVEDYKYKIEWKVKMREVLKGKWLVFKAKPILLVSVFVVCEFLLFFVDIVMIIALNASFATSNPLMVALWIIETVTQGFLLFLSLIFAGLCLEVWFMLLNKTYVIYCSDDKFYKRNLFGKLESSTYDQISRVKIDKSFLIIFYRGLKAWMDTSVYVKEDNEQNLQDTYNFIKAKTEGK